ncbi:MAG TPA: diguanylate cyclase [Burkholderiaceae bacterium]
MRASFGPGPLRHHVWLLSLLLWWLPCAATLAAPVALHGRWSVVAADGASRAVDRLSPIGGHFRYESELQLPGGAFVIDFRNSSVIARFEHRLYADDGALVARVAGGIQSEEVSPFFLRHGRELTLPPGRYRLVTDVESPFFLAQPEPYVDSLEDYRQSISAGNALVLICLGIFIGLGFYYASLALMCRQRVHAMYALFILGNLLYNATALLVWHDLVAAGWFYLISVPILFSNIAYVVFVVDLLDIRAQNAPGLHRASRVLLALMVAFIAIAALRPHWSLQLDRIGVALFLLFGFAAGLAQARRGSALARWYLAANVGFFVSGIAAISLSGLAGEFTIYVEHLGLVAVTIEVLMLALVLSYQFGLLQREKESALRRAENNLRLASTDALTGLPNRYALEIELGRLPQWGGLSFIDLDGLKHYNDTFGHARGDQLLRDFAARLAARLGTRATLHRLGGDEFAVTISDGAVEWVEALLDEAMTALRETEYRVSGASCGSVRVFECTHREELKHLADSRMYENKRRRRRNRDTPASVDPIPSDPSQVQA